MHVTDPTFPPLLTGYAVSAPQRVIAVACSGADEGTLEAGHTVWARNTSVVELAFVFEPEVIRERAEDMRIVLQTAIADGLGAIMPSQTAIQFRWPDDILVNGAKVGETLLVSSAQETEGVPSWLVAAVRIVLKRDLDGLEPGLVRDESSIEEEDGADLDRSRIVSTIAAHMVNALHEWDETGTRPFAQRWIGRIMGYEEGEPFVTEAGETVIAQPVGATGGGALMAKGADGAMLTLKAPSRVFTAEAGGSNAGLGPPWL